MLLSDYPRICEVEYKKINESFIWRQSGINRKISLGEIPTIKGWFLGDSGYPLRPNLLTPILSPGTPGEGRYSRSFLKTRKKIECAFGVEVGKEDFEGLLFVAFYFTFLFKKGTMVFPIIEILRILQFL